MGPCVVCGSASEIGGNGDLKQFLCDRCGPFQITLSAIAVLKGRTQSPSGRVNELVVAKASHYIRTHSSLDDWLEIHSNMIDEVVAQKLPSPSEQVINLLRWMSQKAGEDHFQALEFSETAVCSIIGAASIDAASTVIEDARNSGFIEYVPDDCHALTRRGWDRVSALDAPPPRLESGHDFVDPARMGELRAIRNDHYDLRRLLKMCEEINSAWRNGNTISVAMLARGIVDHVPPAFGHENFAQVASQGPRSIRGSLQQIEQALRHIADSALHMHIRARETVPTPTQVDFRQSFDVLLGEVVRRLS
jgi:hypothetical protein